MSNQTVHRKDAAEGQNAGGTVAEHGAAGGRAADVAPRPRRLPHLKLRRWHVFPALVAVAALSALIIGKSTFPKGLRIRVGDRFESGYQYFVDHGQWLYEPAANVLSSMFDGLLGSLTLIAPPVVAALIVCLVTAFRGFRMGLLASVTVAWILLTDLWDPTMETVAFMVVAVLLSSIAGIALGLVGAMTAKLDAAVRLLVDAMQSFPSFAYMVPAIVLLGIGNTAALVCTIIWAAPPLARMTTVGIRGVSADTVEAAVAAGANRRQLLFGVKLPMAAPALRAGLNQTIMYAVAMATMAAMIGAAGLGVPVWGGLGRLAFGDALEGGIALVLLAILLDRVSAIPDTAAAGMPRRVKARRSLVLRRAVAGTVLITTVIVTSVFRGPWQDFSEPVWNKVIVLRGPVESMVAWLNTTYGSQFDTFRDTLQAAGLNPLGSFFSDIPWYVVVVSMCLVCAVVAGRWAALACGLGVLSIGVLGMWPSAVDTLAVVTTAIALVILIAFPLGVLMSASKRVEAVFRPILDVMQTMPFYLFVLPSVILLGTGEVAGTIATFVAASPPVIRYTNAALRGADPEVVEASVMLGASRRQILAQVRIPLGLPTLMVGLNQAVLIAMAMAVVTAFIGSPGLGQDILYSLTRFDLSRGIEAGLAMLALAVIIDRVFQGSVRMLSSATHTSEVRKEAEA
ncbi:ABC transporter permease [Streptomyces sp. NPDC020898]|uniref:ABC transporter permease n=1 Tax=Streptomyces sp. NPDC020898 TaxID=3365101 RepID=UPI0037B090F3